MQIQPVRVTEATLLVGEGPNHLWALGEGSGEQEREWLGHPGQPLHMWRRFVSVRTQAMRSSWERDGACVIDIHEELTRAPVPASAFGINYQKRH